MRVAVLALALLIAQLAIAMHPLHRNSDEGGAKAELNCAFCIAGSHLGAAPTAPLVHLSRISFDLIVATVRHVCALPHFHTPRLTRGPPLSVR